MGLPNCRDASEVLPLPKKKGGGLKNVFTNAEGVPQKVLTQELEV